MKYLTRSLKYFVALCVICIAIMALMLVTGTSALSLDDTLNVMFNTTRYLPLLGAIVVLAAMYPTFGFVKRTVKGDMVQNRQQVINAFKSAGFELSGEQDGVMTFRAEGLLHKLMLLCEDDISVSQQGQYILIDGIRRGVARVEYRLDAYIKTAQYD